MTIQEGSLAESAADTLTSTQLELEAPPGAQVIVEDVILTIHPKLKVGGGVIYQKANVAAGYQSPSSIEGATGQIHRLENFTYSSDGTKWEMYSQLDKGRKGVICPPESGRGGRHYVTISIIANGEAAASTVYYSVRYRLGTAPNSPSRRPPIGLRRR